MTFIYPLGFLALLAIPVLILIYIIKNRYTEQTVTSTYLWTLSERFLRRRIPINKLTGILSLILQILAVCLIAIIVAHPVLSIPGGAREYCFILDGSGSMNIQQGGSTRFEQAKKNIADIIGDSMNGSTFTLIYAGESTATWFKDVTSKEVALDVLDNLEVSYTNPSFSGALSLAQEYYDEHRSALVYLVTDKTYGETQNVEIISVTGGSVNYGIADVEYTTNVDGTISINGKVSAYGKSTDLTVELYFGVTDEETGFDTYDEVFQTLTINVADGQTLPFEYVCDLADFSSFKVRIVEEDSLAIDNEVIVYNSLHESISSTLIIYGSTSKSEETGEPIYVEPIYLKAALIAAGHTQFELITDLAFNTSDKSGYSLYIFNNCIPNEMPRDGVVWFINPHGTVAGSRFTYQEEVSAVGKTASYNKNSNTRIQQMLKDLSKEDFGLNKYVRLSIPSAFVKYIDCEGNPLLFTGDNEYDNREVVFAFDLADSAAFTFSYDCTTLISRLLSYSFPEVFEQGSYYAGEILQINRIAGCVGMKVDTPLGNSEYPDISTSYSELTLNEVGVYTIHLTMKNGGTRDVCLYVSLPQSERMLTSEDVSFSLVGEPGEDRIAGILDNLLVIFIILAVIAVADYGVYCYEQYQLR